MPFKPDTAATPRFRPDTPEAKPSEIPRRAPPISIAGDRATGFRQQVAGLIPVAASLAAGPLVGSVIRSAGTLPAVQRFTPAIEQFGRAVQSGGLAPGLSVPQRIIGGGTSGAASTAVIDPENIGTGTAVGAMTPAVAKVGRALMTGKAPTTKELRAASQAEYNSPEVLKASVNLPAFQQLRGELDQIASAAQFLPTQHQKITKALAIMDEQQALGQPVSLERLDKLRREFSKAAISSSKDERDIGKAMISKIDEFIQANTSTAAADRLEKARNLFTYMSRSKVVDDIMEKARSAKSGDAASVVQDEFRKISRGTGKSYAAKKRQFTEAEQQLIDDIGEGRIDISALRGTANLLAPTTLNRNLLMTLPGYGLLVSQFGPTVGAGAAAAGAGVGLTSRALANRLAMMRADELRAAAATGGQAAQRFAPEMFPQVFPTATNALAPGQVDFMAEQQRQNALGF
jgi:hypothetical protein